MRERVVSIGPRKKLGRIAPRRLRAPLTRSEMMGRVRSKDTKPEVRTRSAAHALGHRFRIHVADLPGKPDLANKARRWAIFVHGCFWHSHEKCRLASKPRSNTGYWSNKLARNQERDAIHGKPCATLATRYWSSGSAKPATKPSFARS